MAAGLGFKTFNTGDILSASDTNGYLMQGVLVFADATARNSAITSPQEGQFAYLKDTNVTTYYTGSAWANLDTTGMTNPMTTTGDTIYSSSGSTPARLGIGSTGQVLTVAAGVPSWATPAGGASTLVLVKAPTTFTSVADTGTTFDGVFTSTYTTYVIVIENIYTQPAGATDDLLFNLRYAGPTTQTTFYGSALKNSYDSTTYDTILSNATNLQLHPQIGGTLSTATTSYLTVQNAGLDSYPVIFGYSASLNNSTSFINNAVTGNKRTYTGFLLKSSSSNITGTVAVYAYARS